MAFEDVWRGVSRSAFANYYEEDPLECDRGLGVFSTRWHSLAGGFRRSKRTRLHVEIGRAPEDKPGWLVRFYVERQTVHDMASEEQPDEGDWSSDGQEAGMEQTLLYQMRLWFGMAGRGSTETGS